LIGADLTFNYKSTPDWGKKARELSGRGVDLVVEVGGVGTLNESIRATKIGGDLSACLRDRRLLNPAFR
jgi:NADPH:quinone reductase-like Zn-dependent oxidoreductase